MLKIKLIPFVFLFVGITTYSQTTYELKKNIPYYDTATQASNTYLKECCKLDVYYPKDTTDVATVVWFHGGGLENGEKHIPEGLLEKVLQWSR